MPYRQLPNTDNSRYRALKMMVDSMHHLETQKIVISKNCLGRVYKTYNLFEKIVNFKEQNRQNKHIKSQHYLKLYDRAKIFVLHYYQMMNMAIERGELPASIRSFYNLNPGDFKIPKLRTEDELIRVAQSLFESDSRRISEGGKYLTNPGIGVVKVWFDKFYEEYLEQQNMHHVNDVEIEHIKELRIEADEVIKDLWDELETAFLHLSEDLCREECSKYGITYVYEDTELKKTVEQAEDTSKHFDKNLESSKIKENNRLQFSFTFPE